MRRTQINLNQKDLEQNKAFLRALYDLKLKGATKLFEKFDQGASLMRQSDEDMTLDRYVAMMTVRYRIGLQIGSPVEDEMIYFARGYDVNRIARLVSIACPLIRTNYTLVSELFNAVYGTRIEDEPSL